MVSSDRKDLGASGYRRRKHHNNVNPQALPRTTSSSFLPSPFSTHKAVIVGIFALVAGLIFLLDGSPVELSRYRSRAVDWDDRREKVKEAFVTSWDAYSKYAWG